MVLYNAAPAGSDVTDDLLNALTPIGARYEQKSSPQSITNSADNKLKFETAIHTNTDIVASGTGNTDFALQRVGLWLVTMSARLQASGADDITVFLSTGTSLVTLANRIAGQGVSVEGSSSMSLSCSTVLKITAVTSVFAGMFQNSGVSVSLDTGFGGTNHIAFTWLGPA